MFNCGEEIEVLMLLFCSQGLGALSCEIEGKSEFK